MKRITFANKNSANAFFDGYAPNSFSVSCTRSVIASTISPSEQRIDDKNELIGCVPTMNTYATCSRNAEKQKSTKVSMSLIFGCVFYL